MCSNVSCLCERKGASIFHRHFINIYKWVVWYLELSLRPPGEVEDCSFEPREAVRSGDGYGEVHYVIHSTLLPLWNFQYENIEKKIKKDFDFKRLSSMIFISKHQKMVRQHGWVFPYQLEKWRHHSWVKASLHPPSMTLFSQLGLLRKMSGVSFVLCHL